MSWLENVLFSIGNFFCREKLKPRIFQYFCVILCSSVLQQTPLLTPSIPWWTPVLVCVSWEPRAVMLCGMLCAWECCLLRSRGILNNWLQLPMRYVMFWVLFRNFWCFFGRRGHTTLNQRTNFPLKNFKWILFSILFSFACYLLIKTAQFKTNSSLKKSCWRTQNIHHL